MATLAAQQAYQCAECGNPEILAVPLIYEQGSRTFSGIFNRGVSQSIAAQQMAPPTRRRYFRPTLLWGFAIYFFLFWGGAGLSSLTRPVEDVTSSRIAVGILMFLALLCLIGLVLHLRRIAAYNRNVLPDLRWRWEHSFLCRRCGKLSLIS